MNSEHRNFIRLCLLHHLGLGLSSKEYGCRRHKVAKLFDESESMMIQDSCEFKTIVTEGTGIRRLFQQVCFVFDGLALQNCTRSGFSALSFILSSCCRVRSLGWSAGAFWRGAARQLVGINSPGDTIKFDLSLDD